MAELSVLNLDGTNRNIKDASSVHSVSVNGVSQMVSNNTVNLDVATNLITEEQWTSIQALLT